MQDRAGSRGREATRGIGLEPVCPLARDAIFVILRELCFIQIPQLTFPPPVASPLVVLVQRTLLAITVNSAAYAAASLPPAVASATERSWGCLLRRLRLKHTLIVYR